MANNPQGQEVNFDTQKQGGVVQFEETDKNSDDLPVIEWLSPIKEEVAAYDRLAIELKVTAEDSISDRDFSIYVAKINLQGERAGERSLIKKKREYFFGTTVLLDRDYDMNVIEVSLNLPDGRVVKAPPKFVFIQDKVETRLTWISPNVAQYRQQPFPWHEESLNIEVNIESHLPLKISDIAIIQNGQHKPPGKSARLKSGGADTYVFTDWVSMGSMESFQTMHMELFGQASDVLKINYVPLEKPNLYVLSIGPKTDLSFTVNDARDFAGLFLNQEGKSGSSLFGRVEIMSRLGEEATAAEIKGIIEEFQTKYYTENLKSNDLLIVFISSHGFMMDSDFRIKGDDFQSNRRESTSVSYHKDIMSKLAEIPCKKLIFIDACHSGGISGAKNDDYDSGRINRAIQLLNETREGFITIASSQANQYSYEDPAWQNGAFSEAIISGLKEGKADADRDHIITTNELFTYISQEIPHLVKTVKNKAQVPKMAENNMGDIPFFVVISQSEKR